MMQKTKPFFDVFPTLKIEGTLHDKMAQTDVERVSDSGLNAAAGYSTGLSDSHMEGVVGPGGQNFMSLHTHKHIGDLIRASVIPYGYL